MADVYNLVVGLDAGFGAPLVVRQYGYLLGFPGWRGHESRSYTEHIHKLPG